MKKLFYLLSLIVIISCKTAEVYNIKNDNDKSHFVKINRVEYLKPNITYNINGTQYSTDYLSRIYKVTRKDSLILSNAGRNNYAQKKIVELYGIKGNDHGGHIIGRQFGGSPNIDNLIPISRELNIGKMKEMENEWRNIIEDGDEVKDITIKIYYIYTNMRPNIINISYVVEREYTNYKVIEIFTNISGRTPQN